MWRILLLLNIGCGFLAVVADLNLDAIDPNIPVSMHLSQLWRRLRGCSEGMGGVGPVASFDVDAFALRAEDAEEFHGVFVDVAEPVREVGVELGDLALGEDEVLVAEDDA